MHYVYIIQSNKTGALYFGRTNNLVQRLKDHNNGSNFSTKEQKPWHYVYTEGYLSEKDAIQRELKLKNYGNARTYVRKRIQNSLK
ncbi:MAG: GIY-YIG nuclease family protein [Candidatus Wolfebacteria bacterium]|nr:GIY-YIG nuclease family protein [Candidatus Wolfebacteria bacterium]